MFEARLTRVFPAPRERVFRALTTPVDLARWWGPQGSAEIDLRVGGAFRLAMRLPGDVSLVALGIYKEIVAPERLVFTWEWEGNPGEETLVTMEFHARGAETQVVLTHDLNPSAEVARNHEQGWSDCLARLAKMLETQ